MIRRRKAFLTVIIPILFTFFSILPPSVIAQQTQAQIHQTLESGEITPQEVQQAKEALEKGKISPETIERLQKEGKLGTLTPAEIEAGKKILEEKERGAEELTQEEKTTKKESEVKAEEEFINKALEKERPSLKIFGHDLFAHPPSTFAPIKAIPVSDHYIIGPGDEIKILVIHLAVNPHQAIAFKIGQDIIRIS